MPFLLGWTGENSLLLQATAVSIAHVFLPFIIDFLLNQQHMAYSLSQGPFWSVVLQEHSCSVGWLGLLRETGNWQCEVEFRNVDLLVGCCLIRFFPMIISLHDDKTSNDGEILTIL